MVIQEMTTDDCHRVLARTRLGRLACARENQPYVVPIYFVYDQPFLYSFTTLGQKIEWMRSNPLVCVEMDEVEDIDHWSSIVIFGQYEELPEPGWQTARPTWTSSPERLHAFELLQKHAEWWEPGCACCTHRSPEQTLIPVFYRIHIDRITGHRATPSSGGPVRSKNASPAGERQSWLRRIFHVLSKPLQR